MQRSSTIRTIQSTQFYHPMILRQMRILSLTMTLLLHMLMMGLLAPLMETTPTLRLQREYIYLLHLKMSQCYEGLEG